MCISGLRMAIFLVEATSKQVERDALQYARRANELQRSGQDSGHHMRAAALEVNEKIS